MTCGNDGLSEAQKEIRDQIVDYGQQNKFTAQQISIAVKVAFQESSLGNMLDNPSSTASGLYQYTDGTWSDHYSGLDKNSISDQIRAFYLDLAKYTGDWMEALESGSIPNTVTLGQFAYVMHHDGRYTSDADVIDSDARDTFDDIINFCLEEEIGDEAVENFDVPGMTMAEEMAFWALVYDTPVYDMRFARKGGGYVDTSEYVPPGGGGPGHIPGDTPTHNSSTFEFFFL